MGSRGSPLFISSIPTVKDVFVKLFERMIFIVEEYLL